MNLSPAKTIIIFIRKIVNSSYMYLLFAIYHRKFTVCLPFTVIIFYRSKPTVNYCYRWKPYSSSQKWGRIFKDTNEESVDMYKVWNYQLTKKIILTKKILEKWIKEWFRNNYKKINVNKCLNKIFRELTGLTDRKKENAMPKLVHLK